MIRLMALAVIVGAMIAAGTVYAVRQPAWQNVIATWLGSPAQQASNEEFPMCTTMAALGVEVEGLDPDFAIGKKALSTGNWNAAITALNLAALRDPGNADIQNYIGYAYRRL